MKKIIVLAGGADQIALINKIRKSNDCEIVLVDYFPNPPAKSYADKHIMASTLDVDAVKKIAIEERADLVCTACTDQALLTVAKVSEELSLPCYISYDTALRVTNKSYMKSVLSKFSIPTSKYIVLEKYKSEVLSSFKFPLVVKPVDCNSSKGVIKVHSERDLQSAIINAIDYSRTKTAIVEEFKEGREISADFYIENGIAKLLCATTSTKIRGRSSFTILQSEYPALSEEEAFSLVKIAQCIAEAFLLENTPLLVQLIQSGSQFYVLEFSARMGGGSKYKLIETLSGVDIMGKYVELLLGNPPVVNPRKKVNFAVMRYVYCKPGVISNFCGFEEMHKKGFIKEYFLYKTPGMEIKTATTSGDRPAGYLIEASSHGELIRKSNIVDNALSIIDNNGDDIMMHNLL